MGKKERSATEAVAEIGRKAGTQFDPVVAQIFTAGDTAKAKERRLRGYEMVSKAKLCVIGILVLGYCHAGRRMRSTC